MSLDRYKAMLASNVVREYERAKKDLQAAKDEIDRVEAQLDLAYHGEPYLRVGRIQMLDASALFAAFGAIETAAQFDDQAAAFDLDQAESLRRDERDEDLVSQYGRCDTCGTACDYLGCTADRKHVVARPA